MRLSVAAKFVILPAPKRSRRSVLSDAAQNQIAADIIANTRALQPTLTAGTIREWNGPSVTSPQS